MTSIKIKNTNGVDIFESIQNHEKQSKYKFTAVLTPDSNDLTSDEKVYMQKLNETDKHIIKKNNIIQEKLKVIDKILDMYPLLKRDRLHIVDNILEKKRKKTVDYILEKFTHNDKSYYRDSIGNIIDENVNLVGIYLLSHKSYLDNSIDQNYIYYFFDDIKKIEI
jgi:hypothetical protein